MTRAYASLISSLMMIAAAISTCGINADGTSTCIAPGDQAALLQSRVSVEASSEGDGFQDGKGRLCNHRHGKVHWMHPNPKGLTGCKDACVKAEARYHQKCNGVQFLGHICLLLFGSISMGSKTNPSEYCSVRTAGGLPPHRPPARHPPAPPHRPPARHPPAPPPPAPPASGKLGDAVKETFGKLNSEVRQALDNANRDISKKLSDAGVGLHQVDDRGSSSSVYKDYAGYNCACGKIDWINQPQGGAHHGMKNLAECKESCDKAHRNTPPYHCQAVQHYMSSCVLCFEKTKLGRRSRATCSIKTEAPAPHPPAHHPPAPHPPPHHPPAPPPPAHHPPGKVGDAVKERLGTLNSKVQEVLDDASRDILKMFSDAGVGLYQVADRDSEAGEGEDDDIEDIQVEDIEVEDIGEDGEDIEVAENR